MIKKGFIYYYVKCKNYISLSNLSFYFDIVQRQNNKLLFK